MTLAALLLDSYSFILRSSITGFFSMFWSQGEGEIWSINHCISDYFSCHWFCLWFWCYIEQVEADRNKVSRRASTSWEEDTEIKALEYVDCFVILIGHLYMLSLLLLPCQWQSILRYVVFISFKFVILAFPNQTWLFCVKFNCYLWMWLTYGHLKVVLELLHVIDIDCCGHIIYWGDEYLHKPQGFQVWRVKPWILFIGVICILYSLSYEKEVFFTVCVFTLCSWGFPSLSIKIITCQKKKKISWKHFNRVNWRYWSLNNEQRIGRTCGFLFIRVGLEVICELVVVICSKLMSY